ncbi:uncharacterized protein LOC111223872 isoform X2 [Seriola dumerili]|uniref:uncharacterized protein LOC111223872 isoform X2 n=1 Tax=Seriola dumerili TaxID=41447 RepID=UPI000BBECFD4|nr:uncharacterized protein LOC111223872 isoform X2 [Seriola dumerili]
MTESPDSSVLQRTHSGTGTGPAVVKLESGVTSVSGASDLTPSQIAELHFLRSRVRELEREKAELSAENQRLKNMLVHEIPGLLSTMWQTLGQVNSHHSVSTATGGSDSYALYHPHTATNQDGDFSPQVQVQQLQDELSRDLSECWGPLGAEDDEVPGGADLGFGSHMGEVAPLCSQTDMEELRRSCSESQCTAGDVTGQTPSWLGFLSPRRESSAPASTPNSLRSVFAPAEPIGIPGSSDGQLESPTYLTENNTDRPMRIPQCGAAGPMRTQQSGAARPMSCCQTV